MRLLALLMLAAALLALGGGVWLAFRADMAAAQARLQGRSQVIDSPWGPIEYAEAGQGPPVLMIHGSGGGFDQGLEFADPLVRAGFRVIAPSRFGYLRSAYPQGASPELQADALAFLMRRLGVERAVIAGGSAGALSATQLALRHPQLCQGLALVVPASYAPDRAPNTAADMSPAALAVMRAALSSDFLFWAATKAAPGAMTRQILATEPAVVDAADAAEQARVAAVLRHILPVSARARGLMLDGATAGAPPPYPFERVGCPVLAISVRDDLYGTASSAAHAAARARNGRLVLYDTGGHLWVGWNAALWGEVARFARASQGPRLTDPAPRL